jgi:hypothetical protein
LKAEVKKLAAAADNRAVNAKLDALLAGMQRPTTGFAKVDQIVAKYETDADSQSETDVSLRRIIGLLTDGSRDQAQADQCTSLNFPCFIGKYQEDGDRTTISLPSQES